MAPLRWIEQELAELDGAGLRRELERPAERSLFDAASNDYLGYGRRSVSRETLEGLAGVPGGSGASRLVSGTTSHHQELEAELAAWVGVEAALTFSSGYLANISAVSALVGPGDLVLSDRLNHASIVDGCRLSRAEVRVYPHLDLGTLQQELQAANRPRRTLVVSESYFSMDGDGPDLAALYEICSHFNAMLMIDEAHSLGIIGPEGAGRCRAAGVVPDVLIGTFGKAIGTQGAFVAGSKVLREWLWNRARPFVFSTALSPLLAALTLKRVAAVRADDEGRETLRHLAATFAARLDEAGVTLNPGRFGPIFPIILGSNERTMAAASSLKAQGFQVGAIRPPTVPANSARLRVSLNTGLTLQAVDRLAAAIIPLCA